MAYRADGQAAIGPGVPGLDAFGQGRLRALVAYGRKVFDLREGFESVRDKRREPRVTPAFVAAAVFFCGLLRTRSFNALEPKLRENPFRRLIDAPPDGEVIGPADTLSRALRRIDLATVRRLSVGIVEKAERNKVFREGWHGALHTVAIDGWEPICSYNRHCDRCLVRHVRVEQRDGTVVEMEQYYHRYAVAMLIDERFDMALDIEPLLPHDLRPRGVAKNDEDEGELTAAIRLLRRVKQTYSWLQVVVADGLYPNGERVELWDCRDITTRRKRQDRKRGTLSLVHTGSPQVVPEFHLDRHRELACHAGRAGLAGDRAVTTTAPAGGEPCMFLPIFLPSSSATLTAGASIVPRADQAARASVCCEITRQGGFDGERFRR